MLSMNFTYEEYLKERTEAFGAFAEKYFPDNQQLKNSVSSLVDFHKELKKGVIDLNVLNTNLENFEVEYFGLKFFSLYQRQGHRVLSQNLYQTIYHADIDIPSTGIFTSSCQSANAALLFALHKIYPDGFNYETFRIYFESRKILEQLKYSNREQFDNVLLLDSGFVEVQEELLAFTKHNPKVLVFDTTAYDRQGKEIRTVVEAARKKKLPLVLTRSHLKLDSLGMEYTTLGSIVYLNFSDKILEDAVYEQVSRIGGFAQFDQIYPYMGDQKIKDVSSKRIELMRANTKKIREQLVPAIKEYNLSEEVYFHDMYAVLVYDISKMDFYKVGEFFLKMCKLFQKDGKFCDSYGFNFFSLTNFQSYDQQGYGYLRLCPPVNPADVPAFVQIITTTLKKHA